MTGDHPTDGTEAPANPLPLKGELVFWREGGDFHIHRLRQFYGREVVGVMNTPMGFSPSPLVLSGPRYGRRMTFSTLGGKVEYEIGSWRSDKTGKKRRQVTCYSPHHDPGMALRGSTVDFSDGTRYRLAWWYYSGRGGRSISFWMIGQDAFGNHQREVIASTEYGNGKDRVMAISMSMEESDLSYRDRLLGLICYLYLLYMANEVKDQKRF